MRIKLEKGKQKELVQEVKKYYTWKGLSSLLKLKPDYVRNDLQTEKVLISKENYNILCKIAKKDYSNYIQQKLPDNWGKSKGGKSSIKFAKSFKNIDESEELAQFIGILLGDGHLEYIEGNNYSVRIVGHLEKDYNFITKTVQKLSKKLFGEEGHVMITRKYNAIYYVLHGKEIVKFLVSKEIYAGNKKTNNQGIPNWIKDNSQYLKMCLRGIIDTDGSVHRISKSNANIRINFTSCIPQLLNDVKESLDNMGYSTSKIIRNKQIFITKRSDVEKYIREVGFDNEKHLNRIQRFESQAPVE